MEAAQKFRAISLRKPETIRERYGNKPIQLLRLADPTMRFPLKIRQIFAMLWKREDQNGKRATRFIMKGPRGGGKTKILGAFGFVEWYLKLRDVVNMGGSLTQAENVYNYFMAHCYAQEGIVESLPAEPTMKKTLTDKGNYYKAIAASQKQVRGPHPHDLIIDEACEAKDDLIEAALPMVTASKDPLVVMTSTFHKIFGKFQEVWDAADELGYARFSWDVFDVTSSFSPKVWKDANLRREIPDLSIDQAGEESLEFRAQGRHGDPEGWFTIDNVIQAWREKNSIDWFDVELMGLRPSASGMVNKPEDVDACVFEVKDTLVQAEEQWPAEFKWTKGVEACGGVDWGFSSMTATVGGHKVRDGHIANHYNKTYTGTRSAVIIEDLVNAAEKYEWKVIYADSSAKFENADLAAALAKHFERKAHKCILVEVVFSKEKDEMVGNYRTYFSRRMYHLPSLTRFKTAVWQHKRYRYQDGSDKPEKKDDHIPDATMCMLKHWPLGRKPSVMPTQNVVKDKQRGDSTITGGLMDEEF